jgi:rhamnose transport system permease protein
MKALDTWERILIALIVLVYLGFGLGIEGFFTPYALADTTYNFSEKALIALAMALLVISGQIDLSIAAIMALASMAMGFAMQAGAGIGTMVLVALATGAACGALNGWLVTRWKLPAIVVTIGTLSLYRGLAQVVLGDQAITGYPETLITWGNGYLGDLLGMPWLIVPIEFAVMMVAALLVGLFLHATVHGRRIYAIGANPVTALAAVMLTGRIGSTRPNLAMGWELDAVTIVILGGVSIQGGRGSVLGTLLAAVLLGSFTFAMGMLNVTGIVVSMVVGGLLIVAMVLPQYLRRLAARFQPSRSS